jgi:competence protein ComFA
MSRYFLWAAQQGIILSGCSYLPAKLDVERVPIKPIFYGITPEPAVELRFSAGKPLYLLSAEVPLWLAQLLLSMAKPRFQQAAVGCWQRLYFQARVSYLRRRMQSQLLNWEYIRPPAPRVLRSADMHAGDWECCAAMPTPELTSAVLEALKARRLLESELETALARLGAVYDGQLRVLLHHLVLHHILQRESAIALNSYGRLHCRRCGSDRIHWAWCAKCGSHCPFCGDCRNMGVARGCSALYSLTPQMQAHTARHVQAVPKMNLPFALSSAQAAASEQIVSAMRQGAKEITIWAACGAGKTEVVYAAMREVVGRGKRVLLLAPRRDVTAELYARLQGVFGADYVVGLYGAAESNYQASPIMVATTHQAIRLDGAFGLVVLDECDAYPYRTEKMLQNAVGRLARQGGCFIQMTATPSPLLRRRSSRLVYIPARHHGHPLPVPTVLQDTGLRLWRTPEMTQSLPPCPESVIEALIRSRREKAQLLIFVPRRLLVAPLVEALRQVGVERVAGVHSGSENRDEIRTAFKEGQLEAVVATTIFERGLTFPQVNVAVLLAETRHIFDNAALVQMAGRVGRTTARPQGSVWFTCVQPSQAMRQAIEDIVTLNEMAARAGLLASGYVDVAPGKLKPGEQRGIGDVQA